MLVILCVCGKWEGEVMEGCCNLMVIVVVVVAVFVDPGEQRTGQTVDAAKG